MKSVPKQMGSFPVWCLKPIYETESEFQAAQALFNGQIMENQECSSQINLSAYESWKVIDIEYF